MRETIVATQISIPLWLVLTLLGLLVSIVVAFIPYIIFQVKQMFMVTESMKVLLAHVQETRSYNSKTFEYQSKMEIKTENYTTTLSVMSSNNQSILNLLKQQKESGKDLKTLVENNTIAMTDIKIAIASRICLLDTK